MGKATSKVEPLGLASARTRLPACLSMIVRQIARPNPMPARLVVKTPQIRGFGLVGGFPLQCPGWTDAGANFHRAACQLSIGGCQSALIALALESVSDRSTPMS